MTKHTNTCGVWSVVDIGCTCGGANSASGLIRVTVTVSQGDIKETRVHEIDPDLAYCHPMPGMEVGFVQVEALKTYLGAVDGFFNAKKAL